MSAVDDLPDDGRRYLFTVRRGDGGVWDLINPDATVHSVTVFGSANLARRVEIAHRLGVCVSFRLLAPVEVARGGHWDAVHAGTRPGTAT